MKERPILFSAPMVLAILDGSKTQTRRVVKVSLLHDAVPKMCDATDPVKGWQIAGPSEFWENEVDNVRFKCPYGAPGDRLWVKETFWINHFEFTEGRLPKTRPKEIENTRDQWAPFILYRADGECCQQIPECECFTEGKPKWRPSIFMPRWASRITLEIINVRVERLNDISESDAKAEGVQASNNVEMKDGSPCYTLHYQALWNQINGVDSWAKNPWVWVIEFEYL